MKKGILTTLFLLIVLCGVAQNSNNEKPYIKNSISIGAGALITNMSGAKTMIALNADYGVTNWLEIGLYLSNWTSAKHEFYMINPDNSTTYYRPFIFEYGIDCKAHLLPVVVRPSFYKADVYLDVHAGLCTTCRDRYENMPDDTRFMADACIGASFNFTRNVGVFYEFGYSNVNRLTNRIGIHVRFRVK